jgi:ribose-phosphate pyrophosphokinase
MNNSGRDMRIISGSANPKLAEDICASLACCDKLANTFTDTFPDDECQIEIYDSMRGLDVFVIQPTSRPANHHIMELCLILDALKRSNCWRVTAVIPYYGYARQDRKVKPQVPISAKAVANLISASGVDRIITMDLHSGQTQGFFDIPVDNLYSSSIFLNHIKEKYSPEEIIIVSPDAGGTNRVKAYAKRLNCGMAIVYKKRNKPGQIEEMTLIGEVSGKTVIMLDDMIDSAGTLCGASEIVYESGATDVVAYAAHPVMTGTSVTKINNSKFSKVYVTDTIPLNKYAVASDKIEVMSIAPLIADAIKNVHEESSMSHLFDIE